MVINIHGVPYDFADKMEAKKLRDVLGDGYTVALGPDHDRYNEFHNTKGVVYHAC